MERIEEERKEEEETKMEGEIVQKEQAVIRLEFSWRVFVHKV